MYESELISLSELLGPKLAKHIPTSATPVDDSSVVATSGVEGRGCRARSHVTAKVAKRREKV
jgi:hypothetical protein